MLFKLLSIFTCVVVAVVVLRFLVTKNLDVLDWHTFMILIYDYQFLSLRFQYDFLYRLHYDFTYDDFTLSDQFRILFMMIIDDSDLTRLSWFTIFSSLLHF